MSIATSDVLISRNPATGAELGRVAATPPEAVAGMAARARPAQARWATTSWPERRALLERWWRILARDAEGWADLIRAEIGKPSCEAMAGDVLASLDAIRWTVKYGGKALADQRLGPGWQRWLLLPSGSLRWQPYGVIGMIGTWNFPMLLNAPPIAQALAAGNAIVWKPSEHALMCGQKLRQSLDEAGVPQDLVATAFGGPDVGQALIACDLDKGMFTGGVENGRRVASELGRRGIPLLAELSGFDAAIVLPDAPMASTVRALTWGAFVGCGQACVAVKRIHVVGDARPWAEAIASVAQGLRVGDPANVEIDVGPMISTGARERFHQTIIAAVGAGAKVITGGTFTEGAGAFYPPTVLLADTPGPETVLAGAFGPVVLVRGAANADAAIEAANSGPFGLAASVWSGDQALAKRLARRLHAGMIAVNDAITPSAHAAAPFGGTKASGFGRTKGVLGLREFAHPQVLHARSAGGFRPQLFPYSPRFDRLLTVYRRIFHRGS